MEAAEEWIKRERGTYTTYLIHLYNGVLLSHKKGRNSAIAAIWVDLEMAILSEVRQTEKYQCCTTSHVWNLKKKTKQNDINAFYSENRNKVISAENKFIVIRGERQGEGLSGEIGMRHIHTSVYKIDY